MDNAKLQLIIEKTIELGQKAALNDEVPVGAIIFDDEYNVIAESENMTRRKASVTGHAELMVIDLVGKIAKSENLSSYHIATSLEPCAMCAQAIAWAKLKTVVFACDDEKSGGVLHNSKIFDHSHHKPQVIYLEDKKNQVSQQLKSFFKQKRLKK